MVTTPIKVRQDYLLSLSQAEKAAGQILEAKDLLIKIKPVQITIETKKEPNGAVLMQLEKLVDLWLQKRSGEIADRIAAFGSGCKLEKPESVAHFQDKTMKYVGTVKGQIEKELKGLVVDALKKLARDDQNLLEARIAVAVKAIGGVVNLGVQATRLGVTMGGDVKAWVNMAKGLYDLAMLAKKALEGEQTKLKTLMEKRKDLQEKLEDLQRVRDKAEKADGLEAFWASLKKAKCWVTWKKSGGEAETARKEYRNSVTKSRQAIEQMAKPLLALEKSVKGATDLKEGVQLGAALMELKRSVRVALDQYNKKEALLDKIATDLKALGADVDDRTWTQKMAAFGKALESGNFFELVTLGSEGGKAVKEVYDIASGIKDIVQNIASMV